MVSRLFAALLFVWMGATGTARADTGAYLVFDAATGEVYARKNADQAWYPASVTKLMTTYVTFQAIKSGRLTFSSPVVMSKAASLQPPSKMGFPVGTVITIDNAMKMIMVKSANDVAWALGESVSGSKPAFVAEMNAWARRLGMNETVWGNPNGLPDPSQHTTAHDLGILARALLKEFPDYDFYYRLPGIQLGNRIIKNHNHLIDHYPGTDGMKTGFICASGYNVVASATRNGRRVIAVVLGSTGARPRAELAADLFNHAFDRTTGGNLFGFGGPAETLDSFRPGPEAGQPVRDIRKEICGGKRQDSGVEEIIDDRPTAATGDERRNGAVIVPGQPQRTARAELLSARFDIGPPVKVWLGGAESVGTRKAALVTAPDIVVPAPAVSPAPYVAPAPAAAIVPPRTRAPGAILPTQAQPTLLPNQEQVATPVPSQPAPQPQDTPIMRAFTLFQPPQPDPAGPQSLAPTQLRPGDNTSPPQSATPDDAAETPVNVPPPKARPTPSQQTAATRQPDPAKHAKPVKAKKPATDN